MKMVQLIDRRTLPNYVNSKVLSEKKNFELLTNGVILLDNKERYIPFGMITAIDYDTSDSTMKVHCADGLLSSGWIKTERETFRSLVEVYDKYLSASRSVVQQVMGAD